MKNSFLSKSTLMFFSLTLGMLWFLFSFVDLSPHVEYDVFFTGEDPSYKADIEISQNFQRNDSQILVNLSGNIHDPKYQSDVREFGNFLQRIPDVQSVMSIAHGPRSVEDAAKSPLWSRLLLWHDGNSSNMLVTLTPGALSRLQELIPKIEGLKQIFQSEDFHIEISGFPYVSELIRRHLTRDFRSFTILAFLIFGIVTLLVFHSWQIFLGTTLSCFNAAALTLIASHFLNIKVGILTANLTTIVFVMTLSHIVFLTFNWKSLDIPDAKAAAREAVRMTLPGSFWAMVTTALGFLSCLFVNAKPIRELGMSGAIGTLIAFTLAYVMYPSYLSLHNPSHDPTDARIKNFFTKALRIFERRQWIVIVAVIGFAVFTLPDLRTLNTDPSLISFFAKKSDIAKGLIHIDEHGGSNPLVVTVRSPTGEVLSSKANVKKLMELQVALENHPDVGSLISMPLLVQEARRSSFWSFLFSNKTLLKWMTSRYGEITKAFISPDHQNALFLFRMKEEGRTRHRLDIIADIENIVREHSFVPELTGGIYALQGNLSRQVAQSLIYGLAQLMIVFAVIALVVSHSLRISLAMSFCIGLIPLCILGAVGRLQLPLDIISAPAANITISMGIDAMIHLTYTYRRLRQKVDAATAWQTARRQMWEPVMTSMLIVSSGFAIFFFSSFPPTQRFGGSIVFGTLIAGFAAAFIFPFLAYHSGSGRKFRLPFRSKSGGDDPSVRRFTEADLN